MSASAASEDASGRALGRRFAEVRRATMQLCDPLAPEDYVVQSMPDASPAKWHLAHTTWFFETFVLAEYVPGHRPHNACYGYLFNSYYQGVGPQFARGDRGLLTRPTVAEIKAYREAVDCAVLELLARTDDCRMLERVELGLHHEQQHQELLLTDLLHAFSCNPLAPVYRESGALPSCATEGAPEWCEHDGGLIEIGHSGVGFAFDNELPRHRVQVEPFALARRFVSAGEYADFIADGGYRSPQLWLSDGWRTVCEQRWTAPNYWQRRDDEWFRFSLHGVIPIDPHAPVCHVSYYEADAFARWAGRRLPTESEWEVQASGRPIDGQFAPCETLVPIELPGQRGLCGGAWTWTSSPYVGYPGFKPAAGALGEYNGKFMINQIVLRGGSCFTPDGHLRTSYRNFFSPDARWQVSSIRLARG